MAVGFVIGGLFLAAGVLLGWDWHKRRTPAPPPTYPACVSLELEDRPLRQAWDSLTVDEQAELLREPPGELREDLSLLAWMEDLGLAAVSEFGAAITPADAWGVSYG